MPDACQIGVKTSTSRSSTWSIVAAKFRKTFRGGGIAALFDTFIHAGQHLLFDLRYGVDTSSFGAEWRAPEGYDSTKYAIYHPSRITDVRRILGELNLRYSEYSFVDIGCGKGRILLLASEFPFEGIAGVEFHPRLSAIAKANIGKYRSARQKCHSLDVHCADATVFPLPAGKLVLYLYNPFGEAVFGNFLSHLDQSLRMDPRDVYVVYYNPEFHDLAMRCGFLEPVKKGNRWIVYRCLPVGLDVGSHSETAMLVP